MSETIHEPKKPSAMNNDELIENTVQLYARNGMYPYSEELHNRSQELLTELKARLASPPPAPITQSDLRQRLLNTAKQAKDEGQINALVIMLGWFLLNADDALLNRLWSFIESEAGDERDD